MELKKSVRLSAKESELLNQFGIEKDVQIKLCKLKFYTFKGGPGEKSGNKLEHLTPKSTGLSCSQVDPGNLSNINKNFKCSHSSYEGKHPSSPQRHSINRQTVKPKPFKCELCEYSGAHKSAFVRHVRTHTGVKPFKCVLCTRKFLTKSELNCHIRTHTGEKFHQCQFCTKRFSTSGDKNRHEKICNFNPKQVDEKWVENQKKFKCNICSHSVISRSELRVHLKTHTDEKQFKCLLCSSMFKSRHNLQQHIVTHTGEKPFTCQFCIWAFALKGNVNSHEQMCKLNPKRNDKKYVELLKKFKCPQCSYSYRTKSKLNSHLRTHTGEKAFACTLCTYKSRWKGDLNFHIRTHTKEKPFKCPHCAFASGRQFNVKKHVNARHYKGVRQKNFTCKICLRSYFQKSTLTHHLLAHTGERPHASQYCKRKHFCKSSGKSGTKKVVKFN